MLLIKLQKLGAIDVPKWLPNNTAYLTQTGSVAYGVSEDFSDMDIYGFCIPPRDIVFPHLGGVIRGFGDQGEIFTEWQMHHIKHPDKDQMYDFTVYNIVKFFDLVMQNNPNMIDALFTPRECVLHSTAISEMVRDKRKLFLHKGCWHKFKGYAYAQLSKINRQERASSPKRAESIEKFGYDVKFAYHVVRLLNECEQILTEGDLDLRRNREQLKSIRRGEWTLQQLQDYSQRKEATLETQYAESKLPYGPDQKAIKELLLNCLEHHYGSLSTVIQRDANVDRLVRDLKQLVEKYR